MYFVALMEHPQKGRMNVPEKKFQEYLEAGWVEIERIEVEEVKKPALAEEPKPAHIKAIENIEAKGKKAPSPPLFGGASPPKSGGTKKK